ncbi:DUF6225 family protein [Streptomyces kronopolitis]
MADTFEHSPQVWTAGQLRSALADLPEDTRIHIGVADAPGDFFKGFGDFVLVDADPVEMDLGDGTPPQAQFTLFADAKPGVYYLDTD